MTDWDLICRKGWWNNIAEKCYTSSYFPIEARGILASWLEAPGQECIWNFDEQSHQTPIDGFVRGMVEEIARRTATLPVNNQLDYFYKNRLNGIVKQMQALVHTDSLQIFAHVKQSLYHEKLEINRLQNCSNVANVSTATVSQSYGISSPQKEFSKLDLELNDIIHRVLVGAKEIDTQVQKYCTYFLNLQGELYKLQCRQQEIGQRQNGFSIYDEELRELETLKRSIVSELSTAPAKINEAFSQTGQLMHHLEIAYTSTMKELQLFKDDQRLVALGQKLERELEKIDVWYGGVTECFGVLQHVLQMLAELGQKFCTDVLTRLQTFSDKIGGLQKNMILSSFVIDKQPNQIIRTETRFCHGKSENIKLRVLSCSKNMMVDPYSVIKILINDVQAAEVANEKANNANYIPRTCGKLETGKGFPRVENKNVEFKDFKVTKPTRGTKRGDKSVVEEQFHIFFQVTINVEGVSYDLWTVTLPMIITTHPSQEGDAWATILWDNALPSHKRQPFSQVPVPQDVSWANLIELIDLLFLKIGKRLSEENKIYLKNKLFRGTPPSNEMVCYKLFCKDHFATVSLAHLCRRKQYAKSEIILDEDGQNAKMFTFWAWVWSFLELLAWTPADPSLMDCSIKSLWKQDRILGFLSREDTERKLISACEQYPKTSPFILRFPEGRPQSIGLYFLVKKGSTRTLINPSYNIEQLDELTLQKRILENLLVTHLHPNIEKEEVFEKPESSKIIKGYFHVGLKEYWSSSFLKNLESGIADQNVLSPSTSHSHSYRSYHSQYSPAQSPSSQTSYLSDNSNMNGNFIIHSFDSSGNFSTTTDGYSPIHQPVLEAREGGIQNWIQDGIEASILNL